MVALKDANSTDSRGYVVEIEGLTGPGVDAGQPVAVRIRPLLTDRGVVLVLERIGTPCPGTDIGFIGVSKR